MSLPAPPRSAFRNHQANRFAQSFRRCLFGATVGSIAFVFAHTIPELRKVGVAWNTINPDKLYKNMKAAGTFQSVDSNGKFYRPDDDDDE